MILRRSSAPPTPAPAAPSAAPRVVHCYHCGGSVRVSPRALSVGCPHCNRRIALENFVIRGPFVGRPITTCGNVVVEAGGVVQSPIRAHQVTVRGVVRGALRAVLLAVEPGGRVEGDVQADRLEIAEGGVVTGACRIQRAAPIPSAVTVSSTADAPPAGPAAV